MLGSFPKNIEIVEVGPRDGLQNDPVMISAEHKVEFISLLAAAGVTRVEVASFVNPRLVPQMADSKQVVEKISQDDRLKHLDYLSLVPTVGSAKRCVAAGGRHVAFFTSNSENFNKKNINCSIDESLQRIAKAAEYVRSKGVKIRGYISTAYGCPDQQETSLDKLKMVANHLLSCGASEICIADTAGFATPLDIEQMIQVLKEVCDLSQIALHLHDTSGMALTNAFVAMQAGITRFDTSVAGLGGCPFSLGATGNLATEELVNLAHQLGISTGIDLSSLMKASSYILEKLGRERADSKFYNANQVKRCD